MSRKPLLLAAEGVNKSFSGFQAINDLNFYLDEGELRTVIGPNGAGKTTFLDLITGRTKPDTRQDRVGGRDELTELERIPNLSASASGANSRRRRSIPITPSSRICVLSLEGSRGVFASLFGKLSRARARPHRRNPRDDQPRRPSATGKPARSRTAKSNGSRSACSSRKTPSCCSSMNPPPA